MQLNNTRRRPFGLESQLEMTFIKPLQDGQIIEEIFERQRNIEDATNVYGKAMANERLSQDDCAVFAAKLRIPSIN